MFNKHKAYVDFCGENDPRSVAAMLRGTGDGREKLYEAYAIKVRIQNPDISDEEIDRMYAMDVPEGAFAGWLKAIVALGPCSLPRDRRMDRIHGSELFLRPGMKHENQKKKRDCVFTNGAGRFKWRNCTGQIAGL